MMVYASSNSIPSGRIPSSVFTTGAPNTAAKRIAFSRYGTLISGRISGVCALNPEAFTPWRSSTSRISSGSSSIETE
jgi:hypothetical protein